MSAVIMDEGFFALKDGVYTLPLSSKEGISAVSFFASGDPLAGSWKNLVFAAVSRVKRAPLVGLLELNLQFLFARPKKDAVRFMRERACFIDNLESLTQKALTRASSWINDDQIIRVQSIKRYALPNEKPGAHIEIVTLPQPSEEWSRTSFHAPGARGFSL